MSFKRIGDDNYIKKDISKQDILNENNEEIIKILEDYINVPLDLCNHLILGAKIKYITNEGFLDMEVF